MDLDFPTLASSLRPRMLRLRDGLRDGLGRPITYLRASVTEQCNLACVHCRPGTDAPALRRDEVVQLVQIFASLGIRKVRLTGGEPLMRRDLETIVAGLAPEVEGRVHLTTNGLQLARRARGLRDAGLLGVNVNLPAVDRGAFERLTGKDALPRVMAGFESARKAGLKVKLNAVILRGWNEDQIVPLGRLARHEALQVRFVEATPDAGRGFSRDPFMPAREILERLREGLGTDLEEEPPAGLEEGPARLYRMPGTDSRVGVISTLDAEPCGRCNRVRLTSRGELRACRFGDRSVDLLGPLRNQASHDALVRLIRETLAEKAACHPLRPGLWQVGG